MLIKNNKKNRAFSLIELLVSIAIFSIALVMILGATISIIDANKKARTLMTVMNNLNFAVDSMTRSFSTGENPSGGGNCFSTKEVNYAVTDSSLNVTPRPVTYCVVSGKLYKEIENSGNPVELTSPEIVIDKVNFDLKNGSGEQPKLLINLEGTANVGGNMSSTFAIQTTVTQKKLKF